VSRPLRRPARGHCACAARWRESGDSYLLLGIFLRRTGDAVFAPSSNTAVIIRSSSGDRSSLLFRDLGVLSPFTLFRSTRDGVDVFSTFTCFYRKEEVEIVAIVLDNRYEILLAVSHGGGCIRTAPICSSSAATGTWFPGDCEESNAAPPRS